MVQQMLWSTVFERHTSELVQTILPSLVKCNYQMTIFCVDVTVVEEHAGLHLQRDRIAFR